MAVCLQLEVTPAGVPGAASGITLGIKPLPWQVATATGSGSSFACPAGTHILLTPDEVASLSNNPFDLSPEAGGQIAAAVALVWVTGWAFKMLIRLLNASERSSSSSDE